VLCKKHKVPGAGTTRFADDYLSLTAGTGPAPESNAHPPVGEHMSLLVRESDAGNPHVRFDEREMETEPPATAPLLDSTCAVKAVVF